ncbi:MAG: glycosyltransferase family 4 protein, partial [Bryobacteraceae bacterium]
MHIFPGFGLGGSQRRFVSLANHFGREFRHLVWPLDGCADAERLLAPGSSCDVLTQVFPKRGLVLSALKAREHLRALKPDVLVTYNWGAIEWAAGNLPRLVRHIHIEDGFGPEEAERQLPRRVWFRRLILNRHSTVVLPSRTLVKVATDRWRINPERLVYLPNGIACDRFGGPPDAALAAAL